MPCSLLLLQIITMTARADTGQTMNNERLFSIISPGLCFFFFFLGCNGWDLLSVVKGSSTGYYITAWCAGFHLVRMVKIQSVSKCFIFCMCSLDENYVTVQNEEKTNFNWLMIALLGKCGMFLGFITKVPLLYLNLAFLETHFHTRGYLKVVNQQGTSHQHYTHTVYFDW